MYITDTFIGFYTNLFGIEKKIQIGLKSITSVSPLTTIMFIPNAITIETGAKLPFWTMQLYITCYILPSFTALTDERPFIFRSFLNRDKCISTIETYIAKFKAEEERLARKKEKILKNAVKQSAKSTRESLDKFAETSRESLSHIAVASRTVRSSIFSGITSVFRGTTEEVDEAGSKDAKTANK